MRVDRTIANRMREMLTQDCVGVKEGFLCAFKGDINNLLRDYFETEGEAQVKITQSEDGKYCVTIGTKAVRIKQFDTTKDIKRF